MSANDSNAIPVQPPTPCLFVHTPYSNDYDMVPYGSEEAICGISFSDTNGLEVSNVSTPAGYSSAPRSPAFQNFTPPDINQPPFHTYLLGQCEFLEMNSAAVIHTAAPTSRAHRLFFGHTKFELTPAGLRYLIYRLTSVVCGKIETRGMGCYMAFFQSEEDLVAAKSLHKRALFDHTGVWFARNQNQAEVLRHYTERYLTQMGGTRLPKGLLVVDEETTRRRKRRGSSSAGSGKASPKRGEFLTADQLWQSQEPSFASSSMVSSFAEECSEEYES